MKDQWVKAFGKMTYGIYVLTAAHEDRRNAMIASWVSQVSYEPPLIAAAVHPNRFSHRLIEQSGSFALHVLTKEQKGFVARLMGSDPEEKFKGFDWQTGKTGCPVLKDCAAWFECRLNTQIQPGNHTVFVGEVIEVASVHSTNLLTTNDYRGQYIGKI